MSLKKSKSIRVMKRRGIIFFICYYVSKQCSVIRKYGFKQCALSFLEKKIEKRLKRSHNKLHLLLKLYPEKFLNKSQYGTFQLAYTHFEKNYKNIIAISPLFFIKNLKKHIEWLESDVFKNQYGGVANLESLSKNIINTTIFSVKNDNKANNIVTPPPPPHYINTNNGNAMSASSTQMQFYPLLLQPDCIDYSTLDSKIALELRLPPKVPYRFVFIRYGLSGGAAMSDFLAYSDVNELEYKDFFKNLHHKGDICLYINHLWQREEKDLQKVLYTLKSSDYILILVRDPISRVKTAINHGWFKHGRNYDHVVEFDMYDDFYGVVDSMGFFDAGGKLVSNHAFIHNEFLKHIIELCSFAYYSNIAALPANVDITYLDMQEIMPERAFATMTKLAKKFGFSLPREEDREHYVDIRFGNFFYILPLTFVTETRDNKKIKIYISVRDKIKADFLVINHMLFDAYNPLLKDVAFSMNEGDLKALQNDAETFKQVKICMLKFLDELKKRVDYIQRNKKHENDVLEVFRGDRDLRKKFKTMLDRELVHIKAHRPDIIASWKYYQEFEKMCMEEGDM